MDWFELTLNTKWSKWWTEERFMGAEMFPSGKSLKDWTSL